MPVAAAVPAAESTYTVEYDLSDLSMSTRATEQTVTKSCPQIKKTTTGTGLITGWGTSFTLSIPSTAKIQNVQIFQPSKSGTTTSSATVVRTFKISHAGITADVDYRVIDKPTLAYPCNTSAFNLKPGTGDWQVGATANLLTNVTGIDGFTINGAKLVVTYTN